MRLYILNQQTGNTISLDVTSETTVDVLKELIQIETDLPMSEQRLLYNNVEIFGTAILPRCNIKDQDLLVVEKKQQPVALRNHSPSVEEQRTIEEHIRRQNINENLSTALEFTPEAFSRVPMLYIPVNLNGVNVKAFVDTGAQMSIMSKTCAEKCNFNETS